MYQPRPLQPAAASGDFSQYKSPISGILDSGCWIGRCSRDDVTFRRATCQLYRLCVWNQLITRYIDNFTQYFSYRSVPVSFLGGRAVFTLSRGPTPPVQICYQQYTL